MRENWIVMKSCLLALCVVFALVFAISGLSAQERAWQPSAGHTQISIWPGAAPDAQPAAGPEASHWWPAGPGGPGGFGVYRVSRPTMTVYSPHYEKRLYPPVDAADKESCRPDFAVVLYPGHLSISAAEWDAEQGTKKFVLHIPANADRNLGLTPEVPVTRQTPPTFLLQAENDNVDNVNDSLAYYIALKNAGVPAEMHLYAEGGHAFGLRHTKFPITSWPSLVETWLATIGMISQ